MTAWDRYWFGPVAAVRPFVLERVVLFLTEMIREPRSLNASPLLVIDERYTITQDERATNLYRTLPLQQLLDEIAAAQK